ELHALRALCWSRRRDRHLPHHAADLFQRARLRGGDGLPVAGHGAAHLRSGRPDVRCALSLDALRHRLPQPSGWQLLRRLGSGLFLRPERQLRLGLGCVDPARHLRRPRSPPDSRYRRGPAATRMRRALPWLAPLALLPVAVVGLAMWEDQATFIWLSG